MNKEITQYLTIKLDKETKKPIGFLWQGRINEVSKEKILSLIEDWNKNSHFNYDYELCEDEYIKSLLSDYQEVKVTKNVDYISERIDDFQNEIEDIESTLGDISNALYDIKEELKRIKSEETDD